MTRRAPRRRRVAAVLAFGAVAAVLGAAVTDDPDSPRQPASPMLMTSQTGDLTGSMVVPPPSMVTLVPGPGEVGHGPQVRQLP